MFIVQYPIQYYSTEDFLAICVQSTIQARFSNNSEADAVISITNIFGIVFRNFTIFHGCYMYILLWIIYTSQEN